MSDDEANENGAQSKRRHAFGPLRSYGTKAAAHRALVARAALLLTLVVEAAICLSLAIRDFDVAQGVAARFVTAMWFATGISSLIAAIGILSKKRFAVLACYISQALIIGLAFYIVVIDLNSQVRQWTGVTGGAIVLGVIAIIWMYALRIYVTAIHLSRATKVSGGILAAAGLVFGLFQTWYQTDYVPRTSFPKVDMTVELVELNRIGSMIHLAANITMENDGSVEAESIASLMRITGYPRSVTQQPSSPLEIAQRPLPVALAMDQAYEFRQKPLKPETRQLLYSSSFMGFHSILTPGMKVSYQRVIAIDEGAISHVRLTASAMFFSGRNLGGASETCSDKPVRSTDDPATFWGVALKPLGAGLDWALCYDSEILPRNAFENLVSDHPWIRVHVQLAHDPAGWPNIEVPYFYTTWATTRHNPFARKRSPDVWIEQQDSNKLQAEYRNLSLNRSVEFMIGDKPTG
jgi:hypothetical protein